MSSEIENSFHSLYKLMLITYSNSYEEFKTKTVEQDEDFQGVAEILKEGLYAFERLNFEESVQQNQIQPLSLQQGQTQQIETNNDNQEVTTTQNTNTTSTY